jgi:diguanylate cyclase (GGDEF)-like protein/PAS domain S-box-containing protein
VKTVCSGRQTVGQADWGITLKPSSLKPADRVALIALGGIIASAAVWVLYAVVENITTGGLNAGTTMFSPASDNALGRLLAIVGVLTATLFLQVLYAKRLDAETALKLERLRVREMYENSPDRIVCLDETRAVLYTNLPDSDWHDADPEVSVECYRLLYARGEACDDCAFGSAYAGEVAEITQSEISPDGTVRWFNKMLYPIRREDGTTDSVVEIARDVTDLHAAEAALMVSHQQLEARIAERTLELTESNRHLIEEIAAREAMSVALRESENRFRQLIDTSPDMIILHSEGRIDLVNPAGVRMVGASDPNEVLGRTFSSLWSGEGICPPTMGTRATQRTATHGSQSGLKLRRAGEAPLDVEMSETLVLLDGRIHVQCVIRDVSEAVRTREAINRMAYFDPLTGVPNRELYADRLQTALAGVRRSEMLLAVAFVDIDEFSKVNDAWGHDVGDAVLTQFAERLQSLLREQDTVARYASDEFALIAEVKSPDEAARFAQRIRAGLRPPFRVGETQVGLTVSLGIATTDGHGIRPKTILQRADEALRFAQQSGPGGLRIDRIDARSTVSAD